MRILSLTSILSSPFLPVLSLAGVWVLFVTPAPVEAQGVVFGDPQIAVGHEPRQFDVGHFNGDAHLDAVVVGTGNDEVCILAGAGNGSFTQYATIDTGLSEPFCVAVADFDGDNLDDFAVGHGSSVSVYFGTGAPVFVPGPTLPLTGQVRDLIALDLAGNPAPDLCAAIYDGTEGVSVLVNDGAGAFADDGVVLLTDSKYGLDAGDLDGDGAMDVAASGDDYVDILMNGAAGLTPGARLFTGAFSIGVAIGDIDGDGRPDVATADLDGAISIAFSRGGGLFRGLTPHRVLRAVTAVDIEDMNGDGRGEIIAVRSTGGGFPGELIVLSPTDTGAFDETRKPVGRDPWDVLALPVDTGVRADILITTGWNCTDGCITPGELTALLYRSHGDFGGYAVFPTVERSEDTFAIASGDLDGDLDQDLLVGGIYRVGTGFQNKLTLLDNDSFGNFSLNGELPVSGNPVQIVTGDFDSDGDTDVVVANVFVALELHRNRGDGTFDPPEDIGNANWLGDMKTGYLNADAHLDIVTLATVGFDPGVVRVLINDGAGAFTELGPFHSAGNRSMACALADISGDGRPDVVTADEYGNGVSLLVNDGTGALGAPTFFAIHGSEPVDVAAANIDGDFDPDVAVADPGTGQVHILVNNGGALSLSASYDAADEVTSVELRDLDGNGIADLLTVEPVTTTLPAEGISVRLGDGVGGFGPTQAYMAGSGSERAVIGHFSRDTSVDVAVLDSMTSDVWLLYGAGTGGLLLDLDADYILDIHEISYGLEPFDPDSDDDRIPDGIDPSLIANVVIPLPDDFFRNRGSKQSILSHVNGLESHIAKGNFDRAVDKLIALSFHFDGCFSQKAPDKNDWVTDCGAQGQIGAAVGLVVNNLKTLFVGQQIK